MLAKIAYQILFLQPLMALNFLLDLEVAHADDGGDDGADDGGNTETASVQVIHNSASPTVDVYIDGALAIEDFEYRTATPVLELGTSFTVGIAPANGEVIAEFPFELMDGGEYVVVATGFIRQHCYSI